MTHYHQRVHLKYPPTQLFDLVADVERYPEFLPWVIAARIRRRNGSTVWVDMTMGAGFLRRRFSTVAQLDRPHRIDINSLDPMFERFDQQWTFEPAADDGTDVEYRANYRFHSRMLQMLVGAAIADQAGKMVAAFKQRARQLYGIPSSASHGQRDEPGLS
jgi:coenzyme Q-binding protein COQ10